MEAVVDFKSLRARFQEDSGSRSKPFVLEKPRRTPAFSVRTASVSHPTVEPWNSTAPPVHLSDSDHKPLAGRRLGSGPSSVPPPDSTGTGNGITRRSLKEHLPLVLPTSPHSSTDPNLEPTCTSTSKIITSPIRCKKKAMPTPFRPVKFSKSLKEILDCSDHHLPERHTLEPKLSPQNGGGSSGSSSTSPNPSTSSPTSEDASSGADAPQVLSTLEKAKRRFSPKNLLAYARPRSFYCSNHPPESPPPVSREPLENPPPAVEYQTTQCEGCLPAEREMCGPMSLSTFISYPLKTSECHGPALRPDDGRSPDVPVLPVLRLLPDRVSLGPAPKKPPRPPHVDLSSFTTAGSDDRAVKDSALAPPPQFDGSDFSDFTSSDFTSSVLEALSSNSINLAALELQDVHAVPSVRTEGWSHGSACVTDSRPITDQEAAPNAEISMNGLQNLTTESISGELPSEPSLRWDQYESCDNVYEEVESVSRFQFTQTSRKRKGPPKNPYAEALEREERGRSVRHVTHWSGGAAEANGVYSSCWERRERGSPDHQEEKELKKKEKQRLERERKEQKEREKKENEMKKKFKITGQEEPMYHAHVLLDSKVRKHHLQVKSGDTVSIIRTTNCPKGKWLARDAQSNYGYISVMNVQLNMKEMLELGKRASHAAVRGNADGDTFSLSSRSSHYNPLLTSSFSDDSEEWTVEEETVSPAPEMIRSSRSASMPDVFSGDASRLRPMSGSSVEDVPSQVNHDALQNLAGFFQIFKEEPNAAGPNAVPSGLHLGLLDVVEEPPSVGEEQFSFADVDLLPPPDLYADSL